MVAWRRGESAADPKGALSLSQLEARPGGASRRPTVRVFAQDGGQVPQAGVTRSRSGGLARSCDANDTRVVGATWHTCWAAPCASPSPVWPPHGPLRARRRGQPESISRYEQRGTGRQAALRPTARPCCRLTRLPERRGGSPCGGGTAGGE